MVQAQFGPVPCLHVTAALAEKVTEVLTKSGLMHAAAGAAGGGARPLSSDMKQLWEQFDTKPSDFWDNRAKKTNPKAPDFVHKTSRGALWVNSKPDWVSLDALGHEQVPAYNGFNAAAHQQQQQQQPASF